MTQGAYDVSAQDFSSIGLPKDSTKTDPQLLQVMQDALDAQHSGDVDVLEGFNFSQVDSVNNFMQAISWAEQFAAVTGYRHFPPLHNIAALASTYWQNASGGMDKQKAMDYFYSLMPQDVQQKFPGAKVGLTAQDYTAAAATYQDTLETLTGSRTIDPTLLQTAVSEQWSQQRLQNYLTKDPVFNAQYGWVQYGKNYQEWKNFKLQNKQEVQSRFGLAASNSDFYYLQNLSDPLPRLNVQTGGGSSGISQKQQGADPMHQSSVR